MRIRIFEKRVELLPRPLGAVVDSVLPLLTRVAKYRQLVAFGQDQENRITADLAGVRLALRDHGEKRIELLERFLQFLIIDVASTRE